MRKDWLIPMVPKVSPSETSDASTYICSELELARSYLEPCEEHFCAVILGAGQRGVKITRDAVRPFLFCREQTNLFESFKYGLHCQSGLMLIKHCIGIFILVKKCHYRSYLRSRTLRVTFEAESSEMPASYDITPI